jgi:hypothetical protein
MKKLWCLCVLLFSFLMGAASSQELWDLGSPGDWLSVGPVYHIGPYYYPNSDLPIGTQKFLNTYPSYMPLGYSNYYQTYNPVVLGGIGTYTPPSNYLLGYNNPYFYDPQAGLDRAIANHAFQKSLDNYYSRYGYYGYYP